MVLLLWCFGEKIGAIDGNSLRKLLYESDVDIVDDVQSWWRNNT